MRRRRNHHRENWKIWQHITALYSLYFRLLQPERLRSRQQGAMCLEVLHSWDKRHTTFIAPCDDRLGSLNGHAAEDSVPAWAHAGSVHYWQRISRYDLSLAVLLALDGHLCVEVIRSSTKRKVLFEMSPHTAVHLLSSQDKVWSELEPECSL